MFYKNVICLLVGLFVGIRLTDVWDYVKLQPATTSDAAVATHSGGGRAHWAPPSRRAPNATRVLCWIMTSPENHERRALHVRNTWGARCDRLLFMSTQPDERLGTVVLPVREGRSHLWHKTREAFKYVYDHHFDEADWFLKADDDTYVVVENLRAFLQQFDESAPVYFGCKFRPMVRQGYMSGGAGYALSREALRRFATVAYADSALCSQSTLSEDKEMGICLQNVGVVAGDSRDAQGRERFIPLAPTHLMPFDESAWYARYLFYRRDENVTCCSPSAISFHYIQPKEFYALDFMLYTLRPLGVRGASLDDELPPRLTNSAMDALLHQWRNQVSDNRPFE